ncbi:MAG: protein kinase [Holophagaceae bacterium]|nr:protein kinase [Holophagaceae bacterium]
MKTEVRWYRSLAWKFFQRTGLTILLIVGALVAVTVYLANRQSREAALRGMIGASAVADRTFEQQGRIMDAGLEVFTQYSANMSNIETAVEKNDPASIRDTLLDNLSRFSAEVAVVVRPSGMLLSCTTDGAKQDYNDVGIVQMAMHPEEAAKADYPGPSYRGFFEIKEGAFKGTYHAMSRAIHTPGGASLGVMLVGTKLNDAAAVELRKVSLPPNRKGDPQPHFGLLSHFQVLGSTTGVGERTKLNADLKASPGFEAARKAVVAGDRSEPLRLEIGGQPYLAVLAPLKAANALDLEVADLVLMPLDPFLAPFNAIRNAILVAGALGLLIAILVALTSARRVTAPLASLTQAAVALSEGERPEIPALKGEDEVGYLTLAFRALLAELRAKDELLAALEAVRAQDGSGGGMAGGLHTMGSKVGMSVVDLDATVRITESQAIRGEMPALQRKTITLKPGDIFAGRYRIDGILGKGGMGVVLRARDQQLDEDVALKVIRPEIQMEPGFLDQLKQEIKLARRISHKYVLRTHDFGESDGIPFVSMEYLKGVTLKQLQQERGALPVGLVLRIARQVTEGLEAAHAEGVVHRDIKPLNVLFDARGDAKLMDFGLAAPVSAKGTDEGGQVFGTPRYMAPEQVRGEQVDPRTDLYALGIMLFELTTGFAPYDHESVTETLRMQLNAPIPKAKDMSPDLSEGFSFLVERLMQKKKEDRPASASEVVEILKILAAGGSSETRRAS